MSRPKVVCLSLVCSSNYIELVWPTTDYRPTAILFALRRSSISFQIVAPPGTIQLDLTVDGCCVYVFVASAAAAAAVVAVACPCPMSSDVVYGLFDVRPVGTLKSIPISIPIPFRRSLSCCQVFGERCR